METHIPWGWEDGRRESEEKEKHLILGPFIKKGVKTLSL